MRVVLGGYTRVAWRWFRSWKRWRSNLRTFKDPAAFLFSVSRCRASKSVENGLDAFS